MKGLTDIPGIRVGHVSDFDAITGCTAILCEQGAVAGVDIRGSASGTEDTPALDPLHLDEAIHGILLAGGSAFGLEAASGVRRYLERAARAYSSAGSRYPSWRRHSVRSGHRQRQRAAEHGDGRSRRGGRNRRCRGRGMRGRGHRRHSRQDSGMAQAMKSGIGSFTVVMPGGVLVAAWWR